MDITRKNVFIKRVLLLFIFSISIGDVVGLILGNEILTSFGDGKVSMKLATAYLFMFCGFILLTRKYKIQLAVITITTAVYVFTSWLFNESKPSFLPIFEDSGATFSLGGGDIPSWMTIICFILFSLDQYFKTKWIKWFLIIQAVVAVLGHFTNIPYLYSYIDGYSTGEAINTSILFFCIGYYSVIRSRANFQRTGNEDPEPPNKTGNEDPEPPKK